MLAGLVAIMLCIPAAWAQERSAEVDRMNDKGKKLFKAGRKDEAADTWRKAFMLACGEEELKIANNLGIVYYQLGQQKKAHYFFSYSLAIHKHGGFKLKNSTKVAAAVQQLEKTLSKDARKITIATAPIPNSTVCLSTKSNCYKTPFSYFLPDGKHRYWVSRQGGKLEQRALTVVPGKPVNKTIKMENQGATELFVELATGPGHTCGRTADGNVACTGDNRFGQLGIDSCDWRRPAGEPVSDLPEKAAALSLGRAHSCALLSQGDIACWGHNDHGQLGDGTGGGPGDVRRTPALVVGLQGAAQQVVAGKNHGCARLEDGQVACWGSNARGQLGVGMEGDLLVMSAVAMPVTGLSGKAVQLAAGAFHTCALLADGKVACWGNNRSGQLGNGKNATSTSAVLTAKVPGKVISLASGDYHTCALLAKGTYSCWGANRSGQLGTGHNRSSNRPSKPGRLPGKPLYLVAGMAHTCAMLGDRQVACWGGNKKGQLGLQGSKSAVGPIIISKEASHVSTARHRTCFLQGGRARCIGR